MAYLDERGVTDLWNRVDDVFARLTEALGGVSASRTTRSKTQNVWTFTKTMASGSQSSFTVDLPSATTDYAGLMSADDKKKFDEIAGKVSSISADTINGLRG